MPNPIAHPAASIPFTRAGLVFSALFIGSIAPDFGYALPLPGSYFMYTIPGLFLFDVPLGLVLLVLFQALFKWPLLSLLPGSLQRRLVRYAQGFTFGPPKRFILILLSLLVGSVTHVVLDSFTHKFGWMVGRFQVLQTMIEGKPLYAILQDLGSFVGIALLIYWFFRWMPTASQSDQLLPRFSSLFRIVFFALAFFSLAAVEGRIIYLRLITGSRYISGHFLVASTAFSALFIISLFVSVYCVMWMVAFYKTIRGTPVPSHA